MLNSTDLSIESFDIRGQARLKLLFQLLLQEFANLRNRYTYSKRGGETDALKRQKSDLKDLICKQYMRLEKVSHYRDLMIVHAQVRTSGLGYSINPTVLELNIGGSNGLNESEQNEVNEISNRLFPERDKNQYYLFKLYHLSGVQNLSKNDQQIIDRLIKRSGTHSPRLSELAEILDELSKVILG